MGKAEATTRIPVFDGHNDTVLSIAGTGRSFYERSETGHVDLPRAREGGLVGGFFAVFVPDTSNLKKQQPAQYEWITHALPGVELERDGQLTLPYAQQFTFQQVARLLRLQNEVPADADGAGHDGEWSDPSLAIIWSAEELADRIENGDFSAILHFEGAEMIDDRFYALESFHAAGLRSLGIVWSRPNIFGHGVPFGFPSSPDTGPGLTDAGKELVRACNELGIMIDLSHLNEKGFWDVAKLSDAPLIATHSNAHEICASSRNLTDKQLAAIKESAGLVGLNYNVGFLRPDGGRDADMPLSVMADHIDYLVDKLGIDGVALGSDFDGALMPNDLADVSKLPNLIDALRARGYDDASLRKIGYQNWLRVLELTWGA